MAAYEARAGGDPAAQRVTVEAELQRVEAELTRLVEAVAMESAPAAVLDAIRARERRRDDLRARLEHLDGLARALRLNPAALETALRAEVEHWRKTLTAEPVQARQLIRKLLNGRLTFTPDPVRGVYVVTGRASYGRLLTATLGHKRECPRGDSNTRHAV